MKLTPLFLIFVGFVIYDIISSGKQSDFNQKYFEQLNLELSGTVTEVVPLEFGHDYGVITMDLKGENEKGYPELENQIIKKTNDGQTQLVVTNISEIKKNDSIFLLKRSFRLKRNGKFLKKEFVLGLPSSNVLNNPWKEIKGFLGK
ncbi:hypothetical protein GGR42_002532 [Saonia flava]|uniref:Uncharacterized protein n=1 Tax=Saonia flava TaxID=523696 RepID=A0A846QUW7_9FLAO|nr:hypothetical protein [Saonia flava]NJB72041.1 hypothetical protein [Saonia flava]